MLDTREVLDVVSAAVEVRTSDETRFGKIRDYVDGEHAPPYTPREANREYRLLAERSRTNWIPLIVSAVCQALFVDGYRSDNQQAADDVWNIWQANGLDARQAAVHRTASEYGLAYAVVLPGDPVPVIRGAHPSKLVALYDDPAEDVWPVAATRFRSKTTVEVLDDEVVHTVQVDGDALDVVGQAGHGAGVCPVVRFANSLDLDGNATGEVIPYVDLQDRINQTAFDLLMTQTFASFKVRTVSGMTLDDDDEVARAQKLAISQDRFLVAEDEDVKFGHIPETGLGGFVDALDQSVRHLAAVSQTPPHHLLGQVANLSAEALAAAESSLMRKVDGRKTGYGESWEQALRLAAALAGIQVDDGAEVVWRDTGSRSFAAHVDALGKAVQMLGVPPEAAWSKIPGVTAGELAAWKQIRDAGGGGIDADLERLMMNAREVG